ncbi:hypothetical protein [Solimonas flava]|uniref:hypothetical protein n=1 Tax=Solimonas flava TaxID=415849 RepID=UPI0012B53D2B|nr:hypothetical protein [Solimonas flava]
MSLQTMVATVAATRPRGVRRFTAPLVLALAVLAVYDAATVAVSGSAPTVRAMAH